LFYGDEPEVRLRAEVRNREFEQVSDATVTVAVTSGLTGAPEVIEMQALPGEPGLYETVVQADDEGLYRFETEARIDDELLGSSQFAVRRADGVAEHFQIQQNRPLLENVASLTGGQYFALEDISDLAEAIQFSDAGIIETEILDLWDMPILFLLLILLKSGEWILRLFWGRL
jgi:hypothetical protein